MDVSEAAYCVVILHSLRVFSDIIKGLLFLDLLISDGEVKNKHRQQEWTPPLRTSQGTLFKYIQNFVTAIQGCIADKFNTIAHVQVVELQANWWVVLTYYW